MDQSTISTLLHLLSANVAALSRVESSILRLEDRAEQRHAILLEATKVPVSAATTLEKLAKLVSSGAAIATALAKAWGPFLAFAIALWKGLAPWLRSVLGFG